MENVTYGFDVLAILLIIWAFTKDRKPGINSLLMVEPWDLFREDFRKVVDLECQNEAKKQMRSAITFDPVAVMNFVIFAVLFLVLTTAYLSTQLCHPWAAAVYVIYRLYRLPMQMYTTLLVRKYLMNPKQIGNVA